MKIEDADEKPYCGIGNALALTTIHIRLYHNNIFYFLHDNTVMSINFFLKLGKEFLLSCSRKKQNSW
jgi:hypothetical protein